MEESAGVGLDGCSVACSCIAVVDDEAMFLAFEIDGDDSLWDAAFLAVDRPHHLFRRGFC